MKRVILFAIILLLLPVSASASVRFCHQNNDLTKDMKVFFHARSNYYHSSSQGMCVAGDYIIYTRFSSNAGSTTYVILNRHTGKEIGHYDFHTLHSNSLAYNPDRKEVACATENHIFLFSFENGVLQYKRSISSKINFCRIAYMNHYYYVATGTRMFITNDFVHYKKLFEFSSTSINQGMGSDGTYLYICWWGNKNYIGVYSSSGKLVETHSIDRDWYNELEEVDFFDDEMYVNITNSTYHAGIYTVSSQHDFNEFVVTKSPTCVSAGEKEHTCRICGSKIVVPIKPTGIHTPGKWVIKKQPDCEHNGYQVKYCTVCGKKTDVQLLPALGHLYESWKMIKIATIYETGLREYSCLRCYKKDVEVVPKLQPKVKLSNRNLIIPWKSHNTKLIAEVFLGDKITAWESDKDHVVSVDQNGVLSGNWPGTAIITVHTESGIQAKCKVMVR